MMCMKMYEVHGRVTKQIQEVTLSSQWGLKFCQGMFDSCLPSLNMAFLQPSTEFEQLLDWRFEGPLMILFMGPTCEATQVWKTSIYTGCVPFSNNIHWTNFVNFWGSMDSHIVWTHPNMTGLLGELSNTTAAWLCLESGDQAPGGRGCFFPGEKDGHQASWKSGEHRFGTIRWSDLPSTSFGVNHLEDYNIRMTHDRIFVCFDTPWSWTDSPRHSGDIKKQRCQSGCIFRYLKHAHLYIYIYVKIWYKCMYIYDIIFICTHMML